MTNNTNDPFAGVKFLEVTTPDFITLIKQRISRVKFVEDVDALSGMICNGFQRIRPGIDEKAKLIQFYLELAGGAKRNIRPHYNQSARAKDQNRALQMVSDLALNELAKHFFKNKSKSIQRYSWERLVCREDIFEKLLWYFSSYSSGNSLLFFRTSSLNQPTVNFVGSSIKEFIRNFWWFSLERLDVDEYDYSPSALSNDSEPVWFLEERKAAQEMFRANRARLLEMVWNTGNLDVLLEWASRVSPEIHTILGDDSLDLLRFWAGVDKVEEFEQSLARVGGTASIYLVIDAAVKASRRVAERRDAEQQLLRAQNKLDKLSRS